MLDLETSLTYCTYCPKLCRHACPVSTVEARETVVPQAKMATFRQLRRGEIEHTVESADPLYACSGCGACAEACKHHITPGRHLFTGRAEAERAGHGHPSLVGLPDRVRAHAERAAETVRDLVSPDRFPKEGALALFAGCDDPGGAVTALAVCDRIEQPAGMAAVTLGCGGYPLLAGGFDDAFRLHAEALARQLQGYAKVAVACPACAWAMKVEYPAYGVPLDAEVVHTTELFAGLIDRLPTVAPGERGAAFYHDPCYLGRWMGVYEAPRKLLEKAGVTVREFSRSRAESECCGGGGVLPLTMPAAADAIADRRLDEVREAGATGLVTACPSCRHRLSRQGVIARDIVDVIEETTRPPT